jgi:pSer/pThr/pTyr-binding forkhead associated (FHA) protein
MAQLIIDSSENKGKIYEVVNNAVIGRSESNQIYIDDQRASREHSRITEEPNGFYISDLGSRNGTMVNGKRVTKQKIADGDLILVGRTYMRFKASSAVSPADSEPSGKQAPVDEDMPKPPSEPVKAEAEKAGNNEKPDQWVKKINTDNITRQISKMNNGEAKKPKYEGEGEEKTAGSRILMIILAVIFFTIILFVSKWVGENVFVKMMKSQKAGALENHTTEKR